MKSRASSWKQKVDPAFDNIIKSILKVLNQSDLFANNGWIAMEDHYLNIWEKKGLEGWIKKYRYAELCGKDITKDIHRKKNVSLKEREKHLEGLRRDIDEKIKLLPEESREYYGNRFKPFLSEKSSNGHFGTMSKEDVKAYLIAIVPDMFMLEIHRSIIDMETLKAKRQTEGVQKRFDNPSVFMELWVGLNNAISLLVFKKNIYVLVKEASHGDEEAFFNLLQIDRTAIEFEWAKKMIRKAQLEGNSIFFDRMAKAITTSPLENTRIHGQALVVLLLFWKIGLSRLDNNELIELLEEAGIRVQDDPETFRKFVNREIKPLFS